MSQYLPYSLGHNPEIDNIINKVISEMGLELGEVNISQLESSRYSGSNNIGILLFNVKKVNNQYTGQWILKIEALKFNDDDQNQEGNVNANNMSFLWWEEKGIIVCNSQQNKDEKIEEINVLQDRLNLLKKSKIIQDTVIIPIAIGEEKNGKESIIYSLQQKADGRALSDIRQSHTSKLTRPSFWEFDSYESYVAEVEARFEESGAPMTTTEIQDIYCRIGKSLAKLHLSGMLQNSNGELSFLTSLLHGDFHGANIFISAYTVQFIDNDSIILYSEDVKGCPIEQDFIFIIQDLLFDNLHDTSNDILQYLASFFKGYISIYDDKVIIAEYLKSRITTYDFYEKHAEHIKGSLSVAKDILNQLSSVIDSVVASEKSYNNNFEVENLLGEGSDGSSGAVLVNEEMI